MKYFFFSLVILIACVVCVFSIQEPKNQQRKVFARSIFNVVQFPNVGCPGTSGRNGTCYTSSECTSKGGTSSGSCANGYGVCCIIQLGCGQTSSDNCTYLVQASTTTPAISNCVYTICECNSNICRIRLDFTSFEISGPFSGTVIPTAAGTSTQLGAAIGDCITDSFSATTRGNKGSPEICGSNTGQHIYMDTSNTACSKISFKFGTANFPRQYDIKVTQFNCNDEMAGPPDCLQYFTGNTGTVKSFNFKTTGNAVTSSATHLSNQFYDMCFRRNSGKCAICFLPSIALAAPTINNQNSFGLSISGGAAGDIKSLIDFACSTDYLVIPNGSTLLNTLPNNGIPPAANAGLNRICGRIFNPATAAAATDTICTGRKPFRLTFKTDGDEVTNTGAGATTINDETVGPPGGIIGFSLNFVQQACI